MVLCEKFAFSCPMYPPPIITLPHFCIFPTLNKVKFQLNEVCSLRCRQIFPSNDTYRAFIVVHYILHVSLIQYVMRDVSKKKKSYPIIPYPSLYAVI